MTKYKYGSKEIKEIINNVRICTLLRCTKSSLIYSSLAEEYLEWINEYSKYCIEEMKSKWEEDIRRIVYNPLIIEPEFKDNEDSLKLIENNNNVIIDHLFDYMNAGLVMKAYDETGSWEEVDKVLDEQGHSGYTFSGLENILLLYALIGVDFINKYDPNRIKRDRKFKKIYDKRLISK